MAAVYFTTIPGEPTMQTEPVGTKKVFFFAKFVPVLVLILVHATCRCEVFRTFLCIL